MGNFCRRRSAQVQDQDEESQGSSRGEAKEDPEEEYNEDDERDDYRYSIGHPAYLEHLEHLHEEEPWNEESPTFKEAIRSHFGSTNAGVRER